VTKRVRSAKNRGRYAEKILVKLFESWSLKVKDTVMSGQLKSYSKTFGKTKESQQMFESDKWVEILNEYRMTECKERVLKEFNTYYNLTDKHDITYIEDFCYLMREDVLHGLILGQTYDDIVTIPDKRFKRIKGFFAQDGASIVAMISPYGEKKRYKPFLFAIIPSLYNELIGGIK
jgi:hypothetical protein